ALGGIEFGLRAVGNALRWHETRQGPPPVRAPAAPSPPAGTPDGPWSEARGRELLAAAGVPLVPAELVTDADAAVAAAERFGGPAPLKACPPEIAPKSDIGGVAPDDGGSGAAGAHQGRPACRRGPGAGRARRAAR